MSSRTQLVFLWMGVAAVTVYMIGFWGFARFMPPPSPGLSAQQVMAFFAEHRNGIRAGQIICLIGTIMIVPFSTLISWHIAAIERDRFPVLAVMQIIGATLTIVAFIIPSLIWIAAAYRSDANPEDVRSFNDFAWLAFVMLWPEYSLMMFAIAAAAFKDKSSEPIWPRWYGYFTAWVGISGVGGGIAVFFDREAFAWNGAVGFWLPVLVFPIWLTVTIYLMHTWIRRHATPQAEADATDDVSQLVGTTR